MPRHPSAAILLAGASTATGQQAVATALGFGRLDPMDDDLAHSLGVPADFENPRVARGPRALRLLALTVQGPISADRLNGLAGRFVVQASHMLWVALVASPSSGGVAIAAWQPTHRGVRLAYLLSSQRVFDTDVETVAALVAARGASDWLVHHRWCEILSREALSRRFYATLRDHIHRCAANMEGRATGEERLALALTCASRLLFMAFLEARGLLNGDHGFLARHLDQALQSGGGVHRRLLDPLFFGTLNTRVASRASRAIAFGRVPFLNGGLFQRTPLERHHSTSRFRDEDLSDLVGEVLLKYRFTSDERGAGTEELAIDPEVLGRTFESLMASADRRASGTFYTPHALVERTTEAALRDVLASGGVSASLFDALWHRVIASGATAHGQGDTRASVTTEQARSVRDQLLALRIVDPACGSGAFLVHLLERLSALLVACGDSRTEWRRRADIVPRNLFGVDINPTAVWLCELRLWLAVVLSVEVQDPLQVPPLPNLDHNIRVGDALGGGGFEAGRVDPGGLLGLRLRYSRASGARKRSLGRQLQQAERRHAALVVQAQFEAVRHARRDLLAATRGRDLFGRRHGPTAAQQATLDAWRDTARRLRQRAEAIANGRGISFSFATHFPDAVRDGGFDLVIGNPPWVRLHHIPADARERFRREFAVYREAAWERGAEDARAGRGFASQVDLAALFAERAVTIARRGGCVALLLPTKLWRSLAGGGLRKLLGEVHTLRVLEDWSDAPPTFDAAVYPSLVVVQCAPPPDSAAVEITAHRRDLAVSWRSPRPRVSLDPSPGAPWLALPPDAIEALDRLRARGLPLIEAGVGRPLLGVKCGCNDAFLVERGNTRGAQRQVSAGDRTGLVESELVRPTLRGEHVRCWRADAGEAAIIVAHTGNGVPLRQLPPHALRWLQPFRRRLSQRADLRGHTLWWQLFRMEGARSDRARVVWADFGRRPAALVLEPGDPTVPLNTCYVLRCRDITDAHTIAALFNSDLAAAVLGAVAEPARGGYRRFMAWAVARLPLPADWARARTVLGPVGARASAGETVTRSELFAEAMSAFRLRPTALDPLLAWVLEPGIGR